MLTSVMQQPLVEPWLPAKRRKHGVALRLFCFPYAGGAAHLFHGWDAFLPYDVEVCAVNLPGHGLRIQERPYRTVARLVEDACEALLPELDKRFALFGHSMGAIIAFEQARRLRARYGIEPAHLFVSGRRAPHLPDQRAAIHHLPDPEFLTEVSRMGGAPREVFENPDLMALLAPVLKADFEMIETYRYVEGEPLSCPITAFGGLEDMEIPPSFMDQWRSHTKSRFSMHMFPGNHFFIRTARQLVLQRLASELHSAERGMLRIEEYSCR